LGRRRLRGLHVELCRNHADRWTWRDGFVRLNWNAERAAGRVAHLWNNHPADFGAGAETMLRTGGQRIATGPNTAGRGHCLEGSRFPPAGIHTVIPTARRCCARLSILASIESSLATAFGSR